MRGWIHRSNRLIKMINKSILMNDNEVMSLPEWDAAFDESIELFKRQNHKEPTLLELQNLIEILIQSFRANGYFKQVEEEVVVGRKVV
jgi:hypothetical protein